MALTPAGDRTSTLKSWLLAPIALLCLPADWIGVLWFVYHLVNEQKTVHSRMYDVLIFAAYLVVAGFGIYLWGLAFILWFVVIFSRAQRRVKVIGLPHGGVMLLVDYPYLLRPMVRSPYEKNQRLFSGSRCAPARVAGISGL
jgi:hypothetical protein